MRRSRLITHANCPDGIASAIIFRAVGAEIEVVFASYGDEQRAIDPRDGDVWCDFSPHPDRLDDTLATDTIVLDHHRHAKDIVAAFGDRGIFADEADDPGVSGALLALQFCGLPASDYCHQCMTPAGVRGCPHKGHLGMSAFATLIGIRDTWQRRNDWWHDACALSTALLFYGFEHFADGRLPTEGEIHVGKMLYEKRLSDAANVADRAVVRRGIAIINRNDLVSDVAEIMRERRRNVSFLASFAYVDGAYRWSLRSIADVDVGEIAKRNGGGGHAKAAGFHGIAGDPALEICKATLGHY